MVCVQSDSYTNLHTLQKLACIDCDQHWKHAKLVKLHVCAFLLGFAVAAAVGGGGCGSLALCRFGGLATGAADCAEKPKQQVWTTWRHPGCDRQRSRTVCQLTLHMSDWRRNAVWIDVICMSEQRHGNVLSLWDVYWVGSGLYWQGIILLKVSYMYEENIWDTWVFTCMCDY